MAGNVLEFTTANFQSDVLNSSTPVLVDFWAPWCGPCRMLAPTIDELANDYAGKARVGKLNTDENKQVAVDYQISGIPTVMVFKGGEVVERVSGVQSKQQIASLMDRHLQV